MTEPENKKPELRCDGCKFWVEWIHEGKSQGEGTCHRFPPQVHYNLIQEEARDYFPSSDPNDWCGEFAAK